MTILQINHKKNELFEVEFYKDKECTEAALNIRPINCNFYIETTDLGVALKALQCDSNINLYIPYLPKEVNFNFSPHIRNIAKQHNSQVKTLDDITPNLSKYIPEDNAVLFLSEEDCDKYCECVDTYFVYPQGLLPRVVNSEMDIRDYKKLTIFLPHGTQSELQKANEVKKELMEKYGVEEVKLFALHCFVKYDVLHYEILNIDESDYFSKTPEEAFEYIQNTLDCDDDFVKKYTKEYDDEFRKDFEEKKALFFKSLPFNKIITTNSTGILKPEDSNERLQVIDCKEIVEEYLKENN